MTVFQGKAYADTASAITFKDSGGSAVITLQNLAFGTGRISAAFDRTAGAKPTLYKVNATIQWENDPVATETAEVVVVDHDGTTIPGGMGAADAAVTVYAKLGQCNSLPLLVSAEAATGSTNRIASGFAYLGDRYVSVVVWNGSAAKALKNTANVCVITLTPVVEQSTDA
jgi:hypothetical protein